MKLSESQALHKLAAYCSKAERCQSDVLKKMSAYELREDEVSRIMQRLIREKFIDESRYAVAFAGDKTRFAKWGRRKIEFELRKKKIPESIINCALAEIGTEQDSQILLDLLLKKNHSIKANSVYQRRTKLLRYALGKGYTLDESQSLVSKILNSEEDEIYFESFD